MGNKESTEKKDELLKQIKENTAQDLQDRTTFQENFTGKLDDLLKSVQAASINGDRSAKFREKCQDFCRELNVFIKNERIYSKRFWGYFNIMDFEFNEEIQYEEKQLKSMLEDAQLEHHIVLERIKALHQKQTNLNYDMQFA